MNLLRILPTSLLVLLLFGVVVLAEDWPQYRGVLGDGKSVESMANPDWSNGPDVLWKRDTPLGFSSFAIADGRAFTLIAPEVDGEKLEACLALDANTGKPLWQKTLEKSDYNSGGGNAGAPNNRGGDGPRSTPSTDGERVYVYDAHLVLTCFNAADGELVWQRDIQQEYDGRNIKWLNATSPLLDGDRIYVAGGGAGKSFLALDKLTGKTVWSSGDEKMTHATPAVTTIQEKKQVIFFMQSGLVSLDVANGRELWRSKFKYQTSSAASPIAEGDLVYCSAGYGVGAGLVRAQGAPQAERVWRKPNKLMNHWSTPVVHDGHLYGIFEFKKYGKAPLQCVELATGEIKWKQYGFGPGNCILVGDKLVVLSDTGEVVIATADPSAYQEVSRAKVLTGKCWSTPAFSDGRIYVRSTQEGACIKL